jgi:hypothetical protein
MALQRYTGTAAQPADTITVYFTGTLNLAVLYEDEEGTLLGNPFTADLTTAEYQFWADAASYQIVDTVP